MPLSRPSQQSSHSGRWDRFLVSREAALWQLCVHTHGLLVETWPGTRTARAQLTRLSSISFCFRSHPWILLMLPFKPALAPLIQNMQVSLFAVSLLLSRTWGTCVCVYVCVRVCVCVCWESGRKKIINFKRSHYSVKEC